MSEISNDGTFFSGVVADIAEINPRTDIALAEEARVSFLPMQNTSESGDITALQERVFAQVSRGYTRFAENDVLVAKITPCFENGKGGYAKGLLNGIGFGSTEFHIVRAIPGKADSRFLHHLTRSERFRKAGEGSMTGSAGQKRIPSIFIKDFPIFIPPLPEQKKIAEILSGIDRAIAVLVRAKEKLERIALAYLGIAVPSDCDSLELQQLCKITDGAHQTPTYLTEGVPFLRVTDIKSGQLDQSSFKFIPTEEHLQLTRRCRPEKGDVLLSKNGTIGIPRLIDWDWEFSIFVSLALLKIKDRNKILPEFLEMLLVSPSLTSQMFATSKHGTVTNLHLEEIRKFKIHLPPPEEQFEIVRKYRSLSSLIGNYSLLIEKKSLLMRGLSADLLSGLKRVSI